MWSNLRDAERRRYRQLADWLEADADPATVSRVWFIRPVATVASEFWGYARTYLAVLLRPNRTLQTHGHRDHRVSGALVDPRGFLLVSLAVTALLDDELSDMLQGGATKWLADAFGVEAASDTLRSQIAQGVVETMVPAALVIAVGGLLWMARNRQSSLTYLRCVSVSAYALGVWMVLIPIGSWLLFQSLALTWPALDSLEQAVKSVTTSPAGQRLFGPPSAQMAGRLTFCLWTLPVSLYLLTPIARLLRWRVVATITVLPIIAALLVFLLAKYYFKFTGLM